MAKHAWGTNHGWRAIAVLTTTLAAFGSSSANAEEPSAKTDVIEFVTQVRTGEGVVLCALFDQRGWLKATKFPGKAHITNGRAACMFRNVPPGTYAISAFHDANNNGKLDTNLLGMPTEDYCASHNARGFMGPPSFEDAKFTYKGDVLRLSALMR